MRVFLEFASFRSFPISVEAPKEGKFKESCMDISSLQLPSHIYIPCVRCKEVARNVDHLHPQISATCPVLALACHVFASPPPPLSQFGSVHLLHPRVSPNRRHLALLPPLPLILHAAGFGDGQTLSHLIENDTLGDITYTYVLFQPFIIFCALSETRIHTRPKISNSLMISNSFTPISVPPWKPSN